MPLTENYLIEQTDRLMGIEEQYNRLKSNARAAHISPEEKNQQLILWNELAAMQKILSDLAAEAMPLNLENSNVIPLLKQLNPENLQGMLADMNEWPAVIAASHLPPPIQLGSDTPEAIEVKASTPRTTLYTQLPAETFRFDKAMAIIEKAKDQFVVNKNEEGTAVTKISNNQTYADCFDKNGKVDSAKLSEHVRNLERMLLTYMAGRPESENGNPVRISGKDPANCAILQKLCEMHGLHYKLDSPAQFPADTENHLLLTTMMSIAKHEYSLHIDAFGRTDPTDLNLMGPQQPAALSANGIPMQYAVLKPEQTEVDGYVALPDGAQNASGPGTAATNSNIGEYFSLPVGGPSRPDEDQGYVPLPIEASGPKVPPSKATAAANEETRTQAQEAVETIKARSADSNSPNVSSNPKSPGAGG